MDLRMSRAFCALTLALAACTMPSSQEQQQPPPPPPDGGVIDYPPPPPSNLPELTHVEPTVRTDNVTVTFDRVAGAKDYRVYVVPDGTDGGPGTLPTSNVTYRCAGNREAPDVPVDNEPLPQGGAIQSFINHDVRGYTRTTQQATLGHVWTDPGTGRVPVYALGDPASNADNPCYFMRFDETRVKTFTTSASQRDTLIAQGWRDYGIPFYAPSPGTTGTVQIYSATLSDAQLYFPAGPEQAARSGSSPAFLALSASASGTLPLMRVFYSNVCGKGHDELVAGQANFDHVLRQGNTPIPSLLWSGLKGPTTLAVEALNSGCPFQGHLSPVSFPAQNWNGVSHQAFLTLDQVRAADPNGEVFINGQADGQPRPQAIARSFVQVAPQAPEALDFRDSFDTDPGPFTEQAPTNLFETVRYLSSKYDIQLINVESQRLFGWGVVQNEFWITWADSAADRNGKFRITPTQKATMNAGSYLHVTMEVDLVSTNRRYPQILISNANAPIQMISPLVDNMISATTVLVQPFDNYPSRMDIQVCDHRSWDVNDQCPRYKTDWASDSLSKQPPVLMIGELYGVDRRVRFDVWASTSKIYAMLEGQPMACANLAVGVPAGPVTVTFGDVLYHSGADLEQAPQPYDFHMRHMRYETRRHFDELGFKSGVAAPTWDETKVPCSSTIQ
jgi:hypothetical protein